MIIKNVWGEPREYPSLDGLRLLPGETVDLNTFSRKRIDSCQELQNDFIKGYCVTVGKSLSQSSSKESFLKAARNRALGIERREEIKIPAKPKIIPPKLSSFDKRNIYSKLDKAAKEKEAREYKQVFPKPEAIEEDLSQQQGRLVVVDPDKGRVSVTSVPTDSKQTIIDLEPFRDNIKTGEHYELPKPKEEDKEVQEILERIKDKEFDIVPMCGGVNRMGRACSKRAVRGHKHCIKHMSEEERIDYENKKRGAKFVNKETGE